jgi:molybdopterin-containing oxidoreductase family iron-sulfur binding subunit
MARYGMAFDLRRCIGCNACVIGCKQENSLPDGVFFTRTLSEEYGVFPAVNRVYIPTLCNHCDDAPCEKVCPSGATYTRDDGIVMVDDES